MIILVLTVVGVCLGSFVNALVWRLHQQAQRAEKPSKRHVEQRETSRMRQILRFAQDDDELSIVNGRSMCPDCRHELAAKDLVPVLSWLSLKGKCRYCHKPISWQYPLVELATGLLFITSYLCWPTTLQGTSLQNWLMFGIWLGLLVAFMALTVYDLHWMLLPNRIIYPAGVLAIALAMINILTADKPATALFNTVLAVMVGGGIFYVLFQVSSGKWIGGGDVKLGWLLGLIVGTPARALLMIFTAALAGSLVSLVFMATGRLKRGAQIPFGPFLILGTIIVVLFGTNILTWYQHSIGY